MTKEAKQRVVLFYSSLKGTNTGRGGAYFTLLSYYEELSKKFDTLIFHRNTLDNPTILDGKETMKLGGDSSINNFFKTFVFFIKYNPDYFYSFSTKDFTIYLRLLCFIFGAKYIFVKAGGPNFITKQRFSNVLFFMKENYDYYPESIAKNRFLISNRISVPKQNEQRIESVKLDSKYHNYLKIVRISRINDTYKEVFKATIEQHKELLKKNILVVTYLIGFPEDEKVVEELRAEIKSLPDIFLFTDDFYTINASELLPLFDVVVGIGRGFWEAAAYRCFALGYINNSIYPVLVNEQNIDKFKTFNFSTRTRLESFSTFTDYAAQYAKGEIDGYKDFLHNEFVENFSVHKLEDRLVEMMGRCTNESFLEILDSLFLKVRRDIKKALKIGSFKNN